MDALLRDAKPPPRHDHCGGCCGHAHGDAEGHGHSHGHAHEHAAAAPAFTDAEVTLGHLALPIRLQAVLMLLCATGTGLCSACSTSGLQQVPATEEPDKEEAQRVKRTGDEAFVKGQFQAAVDRCSTPSYILLFRGTLMPAPGCVGTQS